MCFLGPVTELDGVLLRPHDVQVMADPAAGTSPATVTRVVRLGFEVRVEFALRSDGEERAAWAQMTRAAADDLGAGAGAEIYVRPAPRAVAVPASDAASVAGMYVTARTRYAPRAMAQPSPP